MTEFARLATGGELLRHEVSLPPIERIVAFGEGVRRKRLAAMRLLLPGAARSTTFDRAFLAYAVRNSSGGGGLHGGHAREREDAIAFARTLRGAIARADRLALEATRDRRSFAVAWVGREFRWWLRLDARGRLRYGTLRF